MKAFLKAHWRIAIALFCTLGVIVMPFAGETGADRVGGTLFYLVMAVVFWTLHLRYRGRTAIPAAPRPVYAPPPAQVAVDDAWGQRLAACYDKVRVFDEVATATRSDAVRGWLGDVSRDIHGQLIFADDLAALGRTVEPGFTGIGGSPQNPAAAEAWSRLGTFLGGLDAAVTSAAQIRLNASQPVTDFDLIHGQLDMLKSQLPTLDVLH